MVPINNINNSRIKVFLLSLLPFIFIVYPPFMFFCVIATGNHFVLDAIAGASTAVFGLLFYELFCKGHAWVINTRKNKEREVEMDEKDVNLSVSVHV
jgi:hypothetical protein